MYCLILVLALSFFEIKLSLLNSLQDQSLNLPAVSTVFVSWR